MGEKGKAEEHYPAGLDLDLSQTTNITTITVLLGHFKSKKTIIN